MLLKLYCPLKFLTRSFTTINKMILPKCDIAVCQLTATNDKANNLKIVKELITQAVSKNAKMVFLPEACDFVGTSKIETQQLAEYLEGPTMNEYKQLAKINNIWISVGGFHEVPKETADKSKLGNAHVLINDQGEIVSKYRKLHLFDTFIPEKNIKLKESDNVVGGLEIVPPIKTPAGQLALSICYDLRFPELAVLLRKQGADILTYPSAFTHITGEAHWEVLLRARAIENQCYVVAAAQYGKHNEKRYSHGRALVIDPWGKIIAECPKYVESTPTNNSIAVASIDLNLINKIRQDMTVFQHRRDDIYQLNPLVNLLHALDDNDTYTFANKTIPGSTVFYKSTHSFAFTNIRCVVPGHVLVSSLRIVPRLEDLTSEEVADLFKTVVKVQKVVETIHSTDSSNICVQDGKNAGQTVRHVHVHILPRKEGDFDRNDDVYSELAKHDRDSNSGPLRDINEMSKEAKELRKYFFN